MGMIVLRIKALLVSCKKIILSRANLLNRDFLRGAGHRDKMGGGW